MMDKIPLIDLKAQYREIGPELEEAVLAVLRSGQYVGGPEVVGFEREFASFEGGSHCAGVSSGSAALRLALMAAGVQAGGEVIVPAFTFIATAEAVTQAGAVPVFADVDPETLNLSAEEVEKRITDKTAAVIPVHLYGHPVDLDPILEIAAARKIRVIQDACQAHGALYRGGKLGGIADAACYSFYPSKNLGACGEAGAVVTRSAEVAARVRKLRDHGQDERYRHETEGYNDRMHALQAAILRVKLRRLDAWGEKRHQAARRYDALLRELSVRTPMERPFARHAYSLYVIRAWHRDRVLAALTEEGIGAAVHYPAPLHRLAPYARLGYGAGDFPVAEEAARTVLSLPIYPELAPAAQERIVQCIQRAIQTGA